MSSLAPLVIGALCAPLVLVVGLLRAGAAASRIVGAVGAALCAGAVAAAWAAGGGIAIDRAWLPGVDARFALALDGLALPYALSAAGTAALVVVYAGGYMPLHLAERARPLREEVRFHALILGFMAAMLVLVTAQDLLLLFVALDLTALTSYALIRFDAEDPRARAAATTALVATVGTSLLFLVGALLVWRSHGTLSVPVLRQRALGTSDLLGTPAALCLVAGVLAKSAQFPLHFWLPRAMVAPTPVSAYLHSAAMVAAGAFVLQRIRFLLEGDGAALGLVTAVGFASLLVGSLQALAATRLKPLLAHSTIAQYGHVLVLTGLGDAGAAAAPLYVFVHGLCKSALFLTAGVVLVTTGTDRLADLGGLARRRPGLAIASGIAAAGLGGLPATAGYFKDRPFLAAALERGWGCALLATAAAALTAAYAARFWWSIFGGSSPHDGSSPAHARAPWRMTAPVALLASVIALFGLGPGLLVAVAGPAGDVVTGGRVGLALGYSAHLGIEQLLEVTGWAAGAILFLTRRRWEQGLAWALDPAGLLANLAPAAWADRGVRGLRALSGFLYSLEVRDFRDRVGAVLFFSAVLVGLGLIASEGRPTFAAGAFGWRDVPLALALVVTSGAAVAAVRAPGHVALVLMLSFVGFGLALAFAFSAAPDVALVSVLIETTFTLLFLVVLSRVPVDELRRAEVEAFPSRLRDALLALVAGAMALLVSWRTLSARSTESVALAYLARAQSAHARDVVTAILADFRGLDTAGEITVLAVAVLAIVTMARGGRS